MNTRSVINGLSLTVTNMQGGGGGEGGELDAEGGGGGHWSRMIGEWGSEVCFVFTSWLVVAFVFCKRLARVVCVKTLP